jgi:hypothetical protein
MKNVRHWLHVWARKECLFSSAHLYPLHTAWRSYWRLCAHHGRAPLPLKKWAAACAAVTGGAVQAIDHGGAACLLSENREAVLDSLRVEKKKANYKTRRKVAR